ncbi:MAG: type I-E CRISPR-associated protein Cas6/Cse3/CasE [Bacteroidetes bacterium SW_9_63_38]|nr:MAG: type I-E CRISPR-associated protein Cas6/Cse3/CasE [Bacteroidetes bacterium SW_9_63_38]
MSDSDFHMVQLGLDAKGLTTLGKMLHLPLDRTDTGYLVHCALGELFGDDAPQPFAIETDAQNGRRARVLGYTAADADTLQANAQLDASPTVYEICDWDGLAAKPMPDTFPDGITLQFELRACPVVRKASAGEGVNQNGDTRTWDEGDELDVFLAEAWTRPEDDVSREQVYRDWLRRQFDLRGGAEPHSIGMDRFSIERMTRRVPKTDNGERKADTIKRPDVTLTGTLTVTDSSAFVDLLRSGLGRHKSFGYGMLKVRRA